MNDILDDNSNPSSDTSSDNSNNPIIKDSNDSQEGISVDSNTITSKSFVSTLKDKYQTLQYIWQKQNYMDILVRLFAAYFIMCLYNLTKIEDEFSSLEYPKNINPIYFITYIVAIFVILSLVRYIVSNLNTKLNTDGYFLGTAIMLYGLTTVFRCNDFYYAFGVALVVSLCMVFLLHNDYFKEFKTLSKLQAKIIIGIFAFFFATYVATLCIYRYLIFTTSCYDFGIFCQMYYYMTNTLLPDTTCERNELLSHFAIHVSPIYYLLLPIYAIFQAPQTLLICQAIIVASGVIPLYLICKNFNFSNATSMAVCIAYVFSPALIMSTFFDFHENKFLVPLLLWLLWAIDTGHIKLMYVFTMLCLFVKEDAFIYVVCIALYVATSNKKRFNKKTQKEESLTSHAIIIIIIGLLYFATVTMLLEKLGNGVMEYRYSNLMMDTDKGLLNVVKTVFLDPALAISEAFEKDKFPFFLQMVAPLLFLPFISKKMSHVFLLIPFFLVNLMSDYTYQTQLGYQYVCGVMSILIYLSALNLSELKCTPKRYVASVWMCTSMIIGTMYGSDKLGYYDSFCENGDRINRMNQMIALVPEDASVECTTYFVPQLSQRDVIYTMEKPSEKTIEPTDFVLLKVGAGEEDYVDEEIEYLINNGYEFYNGYSDVVYIFIKSSYLQGNPELLSNKRETPIIVD